MSKIVEQAAPPKTIGILGAGRVGTAIARQAIKAGFDVMIATAKPAEEIALLVEIITPGAVAVSAKQAASADLVVIAVPLHKYRSLDPQLFSGKVVIDAMNYWAPIDGELDDFEHDAHTSSEIIAAYLANSHVVKTLNHIGYHELEEDDRAPGAADRRALALASDHKAALALVAQFIDRLGYDAVDAGPLSAGRVYQPGTEIFNGRHSSSQLLSILAAELTPISA